jgi:TetR/AcrR family transcriptional regulator, repressor for uid operon
MPRISPEREEATRTRILRAARDAFVTLGFHGATTQDVARGAGLAVGSIYTYFRSKDELLRAAVLSANEEETDAIVAEVHQPGTALEKVKRAIRGWYEYTIEAPGVPEFLAEMWAAAARSPPIRDLAGRRRERAITVAALILREGVARGELPARFDVSGAARAVAALLDGLVLECIDSGRPLRLRDVERRVLLLLGPAGRPRR